ncbi:MAG: hypothetical protein Q8Q89_02145, partial [bacterium]|nr:hypothetical protein [bacterium]
MQISKTNFSLPLLIIVLMAGLLLVGVNQADATTASFPQDTTWNADNGNITIQGGSEVNEIITTGTTLTATIAAGQGIVLKSPARLLLPNNGNV